MARIEGVDVSHWNKLETIPESGAKFAMIKLSEGKTFVDNKHIQHREMCQVLNIPYGYYHYCRAEKNDAIAEAEFFVSQIPEDDLKSCVLALDYEGKALSLKDADTWALRFMVRVEQLTGKKPLLYCSQSVVKRFKQVAAHGFGLWVARYRNKMLGAGDIKPFKFAAIWQYTSQPFDRNIFYGSVEQFKKYGRVNNG